MGARGRNFYFDLACRYGYEAAAARIQELYLAGRRPEAEAAVPDDLVDEVALCGPPERIRERLPAWREAGVTTLVCNAAAQSGGRPGDGGTGALRLGGAPRRPGPAGRARAAKSKRRPRLLEVAVLVELRHQRLQRAATPSRRGW
jgi:hypothetical protein